jgi:hypothetical protein
MGMVLMIVAAMAAIPLGILSIFDSMNPFSMIVAIVAISVLGGILREFVKSRKDFNSSAKNDLTEIKERIAQIEADIDDIKEQIADFIIKQV